MYCFFPIEVKIRDFESRLLMAYSLTKKNFKCVIGRKSVVNKYASSRNESYLYFAKGMMRKTYNKIIETGGKFIILDEEGGIFEKDYEKTLRLKNDNEIVPHVDLFFTWGEIQKDFLLNNGKNVDPNKIVVSGNPRFDLCKPEFSKYHEMINESVRKYKQGFILFNVKFGLFNNQRDIKEIVYFHKKRRGEEGYNKLIRNKIENRMSYQKELFDHFINAVRVLSKRFNKKDIIIRPHPVEKLETYEKLFRNDHNVHTVREGSVHEWILKADVVIHHDCTTGIEAMMLQKPTISFCPILDEELIQWLPVEASFKIYNLNDLIDTIDKYIIKKYQPAYFLKRYDFSIIKPFIANVDFSSARKIADEIDFRKEVWIKQTNDSREHCAEKDTKDHISKRLIKAIQYRLFGKKNRFNLNTRNNKILRKNKFDQLTFNEVSKRINALKTIETQDITIKIKAIGKDAYMLEKI